MFVKYILYLVCIHSRAAWTIALRWLALRLSDANIRSGILRLLGGSHAIRLVVALRPNCGMLPVLHGYLGNRAPNAMCERLSYLQVLFSMIVVGSA